MINLSLCPLDTVTLNDGSDLLMKTSLSPAGNESSAIKTADGSVGSGNTVSAFTLCTLMVLVPLEAAVSIWSVILVTVKTSILTPSDGS